MVRVVPTESSLRRFGAKTLALRSTENILEGNRLHAPLSWLQR